MHSIIVFISRILEFFYQTTGNNLGLAIIVFTLVVRLFLLPLTIPSIKAQKKMADLKPELDKLKKIHGTDKQKLQQAQLDLYKKYNINPAAGCIPQLVQLGLIIVLYQALVSFLNQVEIAGQPINFMFFGLNLSKPDFTYVLPVLAAVSQLILSVMVMPATEVKDEVKNNSKLKKIQTANKKEEDVAEMAATMQQQMLFIMPVMTGIFAARFPSGLALYWVATTVFSVIQQYYLSGPGGLKTYYLRAKLLLVKNS